MITHSAEFATLGPNTRAVDSTRANLRRGAVTLALALLLIALWTLTHRDQGLARDAHIYAFQALARIHPALATDLYLQHTSQDRFTVFSPLYAACIATLGLNAAGSLLLAVFTAWFLTAAWFLARALSNGDTAWLAVALLIITVGHYGSYDIFHFSEDYLTARTVGEALVVTALACHFSGWRRCALLVALLALLVHPLMAFPGLLLLLSSWVPIRASVFGAAAGVLAAVAISLAALAVPMPWHSLSVIDPVWLEVVRERSQFLFLQYWHLHDWDVNARPFICVAITALAIDEKTIRRLCAGALLVGAAGLGVALIASLIGPVAILLQGQAWRWTWLTGLISVVLLPATALRLWRDEKCGPLCAILLVSAWTFPAVDGTAVASLTLIVWCLRSRLNERVSLALRWATVALALTILAWVFANIRATAAPALDFHDAPVLVQWISHILVLRIPAVLLVGVFWYGLRRCRSPLVPLIACAALMVVLLSMLPVVTQEFCAHDWMYKPAGFSDWRARIPPTSSVYVADGVDSPIFTWFTLGRPSYLSVDQSAGVVFSRATALEVRRRADGLRALMPPDWRIMSKRRQSRLAKGRKKSPPMRPLTAAILVSVCRDPKLGFLVAREKLGFASMPHLRAGKFKDWNLYDCRHIRALRPAA